jgi:uncharacterized RmlC-like cupin family protein
MDWYGRYAEKFMGIQEAGDTIFIPAANPHAAAI